MEFMRVDPATGAASDSHPTLTTDQALDRARAADQAHRSWRRTGVEERASRLTAVAGLLRERADELARLMTGEMGKPIGQARFEIEKCALCCEYYAREAPGQLAALAVETEASRSGVFFQPLGVVLAIMPWNFPFWQAVRFAAPALAAGNAVLLKHAPRVPGCALAIEGLFSDAGFPPGLLRNLFVDLDVVGDLIADPRVSAVTLTGSTRAGRAVAALAGAHVKRTVLELGGSDPYLVLHDADLDLAADECVAGRLQNSGQSCIAAKRFIVVEAVLDDFRARVLARMEAAVMGDPTDPATTVGPLAREDLRGTLHDQVERSVAAGARLLMGGSVPDGPGWYYPPTVLDGVSPGMAAFDEELFGPVAALVAARDEEHAIELANRTRYGLGAAVFTRDLERGERIARERLDAGLCFVNAMTRSHPALPFGGVKESGYGRELAGFGIREFVNVKTVWVG